MSEEVDGVVVLKSDSQAEFDKTLTQSFKIEPNEDGTYNVYYTVKGREFVVEHDFETQPTGELMAVLGESGLICMHFGGDTKEPLAKNRCANRTRIGLCHRHYSYILQSAGVEYIVGLINITSSDMLLEAKQQAVELKADDLWRRVQTKKQMLGASVQAQLADNAYATSVKAKQMRDAAADHLSASQLKLMEMSSQLKLMEMSVLNKSADKALVVFPGSSRSKTSKPKLQGTPVSRPRRKESPAGSPFSPSVSPLALGAGSPNVSTPQMQELAQKNSGLEARVTELEAEVQDLEKRLTLANEEALDWKTKFESLLNYGDSPMVSGEEESDDEAGRLEYESKRR